MPKLTRLINDSKLEVVAKKNALPLLTDIKSMGDRKLHSHPFLIINISASTVDFFHQYNKFHGQQPLCFVDKNL